MRLKRVIGLYSKPAEDALSITLEAERTGGNIVPDNEILDCKYFDMNDLPLSENIFTYG